MRNALGIGFGIVLLAVGSIALAQTPPAPAAADDIEEVDDVVEVKAAPAVATAGPAGVSDLLGRLHPAVVHFPIAWLLLLLLLDLGAFVLRRDACERCGVVVLAVAVASCLPALASGLLREDHVGSAPGMADLVGVHEGLMFAVTGVAALALALRLARRNRLAGGWKAAYLALVAAAAVLVGVGGHWGGKLVYGKDFLPF
jgi:uncharacterized membrane protein